MRVSVVNLLAASRFQAHPWKASDWLLLGRHFAPVDRASRRKRLQRPLFASAWQVPGQLRAA